MCVCARHAQGREVRGNLHCVPIIYHSGLQVTHFEYYSSTAVHDYFCCYRNLENPRFVHTPNGYFTVPQASLRHIIYTCGLLVNQGWDWKLTLPPLCDENWRMSWWDWLGWRLLRAFLSWKGPQGFKREELRLRREEEMFSTVTVLTATSPAPSEEEEWSLEYTPQVQYFLPVPTSPKSTAEL